MKYFPLLLLWLVILTGTWTDLGQDFFGPTKDLREIKKEMQTTEFASTRQPSRERTTANPNLDKAKEFLAANNVNEAIVQFEAGLSNKAWAQDNPRRWAENVQILLSLANPSLSYELLSSFVSQGSVPESLRVVVGHWRVHAREWANADTNRNVEQSISDVKQLLDRADDLQSKDARRPVGLVLYMRSNALATSILQAPNQDKNPEAISLAARAAGSLQHLTQTISVHKVEAQAEY